MITTADGPNAVCAKQWNGYDPSFFFFFLDMTLLKGTQEKPILFSILQMKKWSSTAAWL